MAETVCRRTRCCKPGAQGVSGEIGARAVKGKCAPTPAKCRNAAIAILNVQQPLDASLRSGGGFGAGCIVAQQVQREQRPRRVVRIGHSARQVGPRPAATRSIGIEVALMILLIE